MDDLLLRRGDFYEDDNPHNFVDKFRCSSYPMSFFLMPVADGPEGARYKPRKAKRPEGQKKFKWQDRFEELCAELGTVL